MFRWPRHQNRNSRSAYAEAFAERRKTEKMNTRENATIQSPVMQENALTPYI